MKKQALNPYLPSYEYIPDGEPHVFGERVYLYGSHDRFGAAGFCLNDYVCYSADVHDLTDWKYEGVILRKDQDPRNQNIPADAPEQPLLFGIEPEKEEDLNPRGVHAQWAPDVVRGLDGRYYLYYCLDFLPEIGVAVCDTPAGKYEFLGFVRYPDGTSLGLKEGDMDNFDPGVFIDDGTVYLYSGHAAMRKEQVGANIQSLVMELETDMLTIKTKPKILLPDIFHSEGTGFEGHEFFEASSIRKVGDKYYFVYSSVNSHELCYAVSDRPEGGYIYGGTVVDLADVYLDGRTEKDAVNPLGNTHGGIEFINGEWYVFYHRQTNRTNFSRQGCAERIQIDEDGMIHQAEVTSCGLNGGPLRGEGWYPAYCCCHLTGKNGAKFSHPLAMKMEDPYLTQDAEDVEPESESAKRDADFPTQYVKNLKDGATVGFKYFDCNHTILRSLTLRGNADGVLEVRTRKDGKILGMIELHLSSESWSKVKTAVCLPDGVNALYLTFCGIGVVDFAEFVLETEHEKYLDSSLSAEERADDLLVKMSLNEKFAQTQCGFAERLLENGEYPYGMGQVSCLFASMLETVDEGEAVIEELQKRIIEASPHHIPAIFHVETATGTLLPEVANFPIELAQASTWDPELEKQMGYAIGRQTRAAGIHQGLAPVLDLCRDSRFGRQGETFGEDGTLAAAMGSAYVQGLQNDGNVEKAIFACGKHFLGFMSGMGGIHAAKTTTNPREIREVYAKPFQAAIAEAKIGSIMNAYASYDGMPAGGSRELLTDLLRGEMKFDGTVIADYSSVSQLHTNHCVAESLEEAGEIAMCAGMDVELPQVESFNEDLKARFAGGETDMAVLDQAVRRSLIHKFRLGLFENPFPMKKENRDAVVYDEKAQEISRNMAREAMILLKNDGVLPLKNTAEPGEKETSGKVSGKKKAAVIGWHGGTTRAFMGCYMYIARIENSFGGINTMAGIEGSSDPTCEKVSAETYPGSKILVEHPQTDALIRKCYPGIHSLYEELKERCPEWDVQYAYGYPQAGNDTSHFEKALKLAAESDLVIVTLGGKYGWNTGCTMGEGIDSMNIQIPECQELFLRELAKLGKPSVGVHFDGRPVSSDAADETLNALIEAWTPGRYGAEAVTDVLLGEYNPAGRLPISVALNAGQIPVYYSHERGSSYHAGESIGFQDYADGSHKPRYCFGYGLSYTEFVYERMEIEKKAILPFESWKIDVTVKNTGNVDGEEVVQLYMSDEYASMTRPVKELVGFKRVKIRAGECVKVRFDVAPSQMAFLDADMRWKIEKGDFIVQAASSSEDVRLEDRLYVKENAFIEGAVRSFYAKAITEGNE